MSFSMEGRFSYFPEDIGTSSVCLLLLFSKNIRDIILVRSIITYKRK